MGDPNAFLHSSLHGDILVLTILQPRIEGEDTAAALKEELLAAVKQHEASKVVLDLSHTRYVSSIVFWPLLNLRRQLSQQQGSLILCGLTGAVEEVFTSTKMVTSSGATNAPFEFAPDRESALARLRGEAPASPGEPSS